MKVAVIENNVREGNRVDAFMQKYNPVRLKYLLNLQDKP
jgi:hypothetical protein